MSNLLNKEIKIASHPTTVIFLLLSAMLLIPNYPYYVIFFYTALGIFFICMQGRENHDIFYTMTLPICKKDIVKARFLFVCLLELLQAVIAVPFAILRQSFGFPNQVGMDANIAFFGISLLLMGIFNFVFFTRYYKKPDKVGIAFVWGSVIMWVFIIIAEACAHAIPFVRDCLDTGDPAYLGAKLFVLAMGLLLYLLLTLLAYRRSVHSFVALDL